MPQLRKSPEYLIHMPQHSKMSKKGSTSRTFKFRILAVLSITALLCFICVCGLTSGFSIKIAYFKAGELFVATPKTAAVNKTIRTTVSEQKVQEDGESDILMTAPRKGAPEERMEWFRNILPQLRLLNSTSLSKKFHGRVLEFFNNNCSAQFFMVWLSRSKSFGPREFLTLDSLFSVHPKGCLLILSHSIDSPEGHRIIKPLLDRGFRVLAVTPDIPFLVQNTPAESWVDRLKTGNVDPGTVPLFVNLSNLIRLAVLYKYGGVYLDTDFVFLKDMSGLRNAIGAQSLNSATRKWTRLNGAVMIFEINHPILREFLYEFSTTFNGNKWGHNGPYLVSRVIERVGNRPEYNLTIFPPKAFYPVDWIKIAKLFKKPENEDEMRWVEATVHDIGSRSYAVHLWNKVNRDRNIEDGSTIQKLLSTHCAICKDL